ncbi:MAG: hypothetical protein J3Q66DRAFT_334496 [Benniella sp.]|nr:MAG: hypothetical protein J3Q66DRAFT_334496 [Benniella sp.]
MISKLFKVLLAAAVVSQVSARFCVEQGEHSCDSMTHCEMEFRGFSNGRDVGNVAFNNYHFGGTEPRWVCTSNGDWCLHTTTMRVKACNKETALDNNWCANIC